MPNIRSRKSPSVLTNLQEEINQLFYPFVANSGSDLTDILAGDWSPRIDLKEEDQQFVVQADIPGVRPEDIEVSMDGDVLTIKGHKKTEKEQSSEGYLRVERSTGSFLRQFSLPSSVNADEIKATSKDGVLKLTIPKNNKTKGRKISVQAEH